MSQSVGDVQMLEGASPSGESWSSLNRIGPFGLKLRPISTRPELRPDPEESPIPFSQIIVR